MIHESLNLNPPWYKRLAVQMFGCVKYYTIINEEARPDGIEWVYLARCKEHGYFVDTLHGFSEMVYCPWCRIERTEELERLKAKPVPNK